MTGQVLFDPLLPMGVIWGAAGLALALVGFGAWRGLRGWALRGLAALALLVAVANPSWQQEERSPLSDIVLMVVDQSASQQIGARPDQTEAAATRLAEAVAALPDTELRRVTLTDAPDNGGTRAMEALAGMVAQEPRGRIAGALIVTDGQIHDAAQAPDLPAPLHVLLTGERSDWDRRLILRNAPAFGILGELAQLTLHVADEGKVPRDLAGVADLEISIDGTDPIRLRVPVGQDVTLPLNLPHAGLNVLRLALDPQPGELTVRNNAAVVQINVLRDRLRVLLVSGEPHAGERTWRNLLKSDSSVDLVHFTILRPPEKQDGVPVTELSLIAFPTRELFMEKIEDFDLIIFDRYRRRGILPMLYLDNVRNYVLDGGALLIAAGPDFAGADSLFRSPLSGVIPAAPTARVIEQPFLPELTEAGQRHPVTAGLDLLEPLAPEAPPWGRWFRIVDTVAQSGDVVMVGPDERPLLVLDRVGEGRVALLTSDHAWLWSRGYEGGGPQLELLRRLAHWMMREPGLEEEALVVTAEGNEATITRRTMADSAAPVAVTAPDGSTRLLTLEPVAPGRFEAVFAGTQDGVYALTDGLQRAVVALGPAAPLEFERTIATPDLLAPVSEATGGGIRRIEDGLPGLRKVREGGVSAGRGWLGITARNAHVTTDLRVTPLVAPLLFLLLAAGLILAAWLREGRRLGAAP